MNKLTVDLDKITLKDFTSFLSKYEVVESVPVEPDPIPDPEDPTPEPEPEEPTNPNPDPVPTTSNIEKFVDVYYNSKNVITDSNGVVTKLKAIKGPDLPYSGTKSPALEMPYVTNGEVVIMNQPNVTYKKQIKENSKPFPLPEEYSLIIRKTPGTDWETVWNGWGDYYMGFGMGKLRLLNNSYYTKVPQPPFFQLVMLHILVEDGKATIWVNGNKASEENSKDIYRRLGYGLGSDTNSTDYNWLATMYIERKMSDSERNEYFKTVKAEYNLGSYPDLPYATDISVSNKNGKLTVNYKYNGKYAEDKTKTEYKWYKSSNGLATQTLIGTTSSINKQSSVKACVKVYDIKGNSYMFVSGTYN